MLTLPLMSKSISKMLASALWYYVIRLVLVLTVTTDFVQPSFQLCSGACMSVDSVEVSLCICTHCDLPSYQ